MCVSSRSLLLWSGWSLAIDVTAVVPGHPIQTHRFIKAEFILLNLNLIPILRVPAHFMRMRAHHQLRFCNGSVLVERFLSAIGDHNEEAHVYHRHSDGSARQCELRSRPEQPKTRCLDRQ